MNFQPLLKLAAAVLAAVLCTLPPTGAGAATFSGVTQEAFGTYDDVEFVRYTGRFEGATSLGAYDVPFEMVAPADVSQANGRVLFEPPHFVFGPGVRDLSLTRNLIFERQFSYATVGWGANGLNVLDPTATPIIIADEPVSNPGQIDLLGILDEQIIVQFVEALKTDSLAASLVGPNPAIYATGISQTADALLNLYLGPNGAGLFDFSLLIVGLWEADFPGPNPWDRSMGEFDPPTGVGKVIMVHAEGDLLISNSEQHRNAVADPNYRIYEVAGSAHQPIYGQLGIADLLPFEPNSLDWAPVARAAFVAGDAWVQKGIDPPPTALLRDATGIDPIYGFETGIARDLDGNALGGVRLPEVETSQATYVAALPDFEVLPGLPGLVGLEIDLTCAPRPDGSIRFPTHGDYVSRFAHQANVLVNQGYLLSADAEAMKERAAESDIGKPGTCD